MKGASVWAAGALMSLVACSVPSLEGLDPGSSVEVDVSFDFRAGCIVVLARDKADPAKAERQTFLVRDRGAAERQVTVSLKGEGIRGQTLEVISTAHEQTCDGAEVARDTQEASLARLGPQKLTVRLSAVDADGDGYVPVAAGGSDCDDRNAEVSARSFYKDADGDGYGAGAEMRGCVAAAGYVERAGDCDDTSSSRAPGREELCDGVDNNCVGGVDEGLLLSPFYLDADGDGVGAGPEVRACSAPAAHVSVSGDCDDRDAARKPGLTEACDEKDNDCDGAVDEGLAVATYYRDADADGYGNPSDSRQKCSQPSGYVTNGSDCNDVQAAVHPGATEVCNEADDNCDGATDEGFNKRWYRDADGDGYGAGAAVTACGAPAGYVAQSGDCNDNASSVRPGATEVCNDVDDNCAGGVDEGFNKTWHQDSDADGYGIAGATVTSCSRPAGYSAPTSVFDCNDSNAAISPGASERCNSDDDDCDGSTDEDWPNLGLGCLIGGCPGTRACNSTGTGTICVADVELQDKDGDGAVSSGAPDENAICFAGGAPAGAQALHADCDDSDPYNNPDGVEVCDDRDNDCGGDVDEDGVCAGAGWRELADAAVIGRDWYAVAVSRGSPSGYPVWLAGAEDALARRGGPGEPFVSFDGECSAGARWTAAWVRQSDGHVFLAGSNGLLAEHTGKTCTVTRFWGEHGDATSIRGLASGETTSLFITLGHSVLLWTPGTAPVKVGTADPSIRGHAFLPDTSLERGFTPTAVSAPHPMSVYVTDSQGAILRHAGRAGASTWLTRFRASGVLLDLDVASPANVWAVGPGGRVVHFPEP